jgi:SAM-dependent methyltransferase
VHEADQSSWAAYRSRVPLPDASRLLDLPAATWRALGERFRAIGLDEESTRATLREIAPAPLRAMRLPMQVWHARRRGDVVGHALRMFVLADPVTRAEAAAVLGDLPVAALVATGLLVEDAAAAVVSPFHLDILGRDYAFADHAEHVGEAVMGEASSTHILASAAMPRGHRPGRALDLGCGSGTLGILLARVCGSVVATDVNPRAVAMARANAMLDGIANLEVRLGDLFEPVAGERFDLVVSQPPFVGQPEGTEAATYLFGGPRGDELPIRVLAGVMDHVADGGRALVLAEWPTAPGDASIESRMRAAVGNDDVDALAVLGPKASLEQHCMFYAASHHATLDAGYAETALAWRTYLARLGVSEIRLGMQVLERPKGRRGFTSVVPTHNYATDLTEAHVDRWIAARALVARGPEALLDAKVVVAAGATFAPDATKPDRVLARPPVESLLEPVVINGGTYKLLAFVDRAAKVREAAESLAAATKATKEEAEAKVVAGVTQGLMLGLLEPVGDPT